MNEGILLAVIGAALAATLPGIGSAFGVQMSGKSASGVLAEKPEMFGKLLVLSALPGTQGIYGFLTAVLLLVQIGMLSGSPAALTTAQGWQFFGACMPVAVVCFLSALAQGRAAVSAIHMVAKQPDMSGKAITLVALVETYAILSLLASILMIFSL